MAQDDEAPTAALIVREARARPFDLLDSARSPATRTISDAATSSPVASGVGAALLLTSAASAVAAAKNPHRIDEIVIA